MLKRLFQLPEFKDLEQQRRAHILIATQAAAVLMMFLILVISLILTPDHPEVIPQTFAGIILIIFSYYLLKRKKVEAAGWVIVILGWLVMTLDLLFISGIRGVNVLGQVLIVMFAGLAIGGRAALFITAANFVANYFVLYFEQTGILVDPAPLEATYARYIILSIYSTLAAIYIWRADTIIKKAFAETQATADRYRSLFERTNDGVLILDLDWCVLNSNPQAAELLGFGPQEFVGESFSTWFGPENNGQAIKELDEILTGTDLPVVENIIRNRRGLKIPVEVSLALVPDSSGVPHHIQCILRDITERKEYERTLIYEAHHDPLTGLFNRKYLETEVLTAKTRREDDQTQLAALFIDIDDFKDVNDKFGHTVGDLVLKEFGGRLLSSVRATDTVFRLGGDEFLILLENVHTRENVSKVAGKIISAISNPFTFDELVVQLTVSIGIALTDKSNLSNMDLLHTADAAMYQVKDDGKNDFKFFEEKASP
jgi:diguanylate cyclase (GGDEF)-like protein/PAS domain S-box-containing protein